MGENDVRDAPQDFFLLKITVMCAHIPCMQVLGNHLLPSGNEVHMRRALRGQNQENLSFVFLWSIRQGRCLKQVIFGGLCSLRTDETLK
jgi:hypothetical protein